MRFYLWSFCNVFTTWLFYKPIMGLTKMIWTLQWLLHLTEASTKLSMKQENISEKKFLGTRVRSSKRCCVRFPTLRFMSTRPLDLDSLSAACLLLRILPLTIIELVQQLSQERKRATLGPSVKDFCAATAFPAWHWRRGVKKGGDMIYTLIRNVSFSTGVSHIGLETSRFQDFPDFSENLRICAPPWQKNWSWKKSLFWYPKIWEFTN